MHPVDFWHSLRSVFALPARLYAVAVLGQKVQTDVCGRMCLSAWPGGSPKNREGDAEQRARGTMMS
jgi:hypothetical protein